MIEVRFKNTSGLFNRMGDRKRPSVENERQETGIGNLTCSFGANVEEAELQLTKVGSYH